MKVHCLFEQSGTFKNEFRKLGYDAEDYDILNDFGETDHIIDLFEQIELAYNEEDSIFDDIAEDDLILAFFPCTRFENQILLHFRGQAVQMKNYYLAKKLEKDLALHNELHQLYSLITKLVLICIQKGAKLVIENPYSEQHYLHRYWALTPTLIDYNRKDDGDYYKKPTQYFFINFEPYNNLIMDEAIDCHPKKVISKTSSTVERSMISKGYARRFIRTYLIPKENL